VHNSKKRCFFFLLPFKKIIIISCFVFLTCMRLCILQIICMQVLFVFFNSYVWLVNMHVLILQITRIHKCIWYFLGFLVIWGFPLNLPLMIYIFFERQVKHTHVFPRYRASAIGSPLIPADHRPTQLRVPLCGRPLICISPHAHHGVRTRVIRDTIHWPSQGC